MKLYHYYRREQEPFFSLSYMDDDAAIGTMAEIYRQRGESILDGRFREPEKYLGYRRRTEQWLLEEFTRRGGNPTDDYPCYFTAGCSDWLIEQLTDDYCEVAIEASLLSVDDVSFTYPDSMTSWGYGILKPQNQYDPNLHGQVFLVHEIGQVLEEMNRPTAPTAYYLGNSVPQYVEAQVWNAAALRKLLQCKSSGVEFRQMRGST